MAEGNTSLDEGRLIRIEPDDRIVVLARTLQARGAGLEAACKRVAADRSGFETCLGQALYRHRSVFRGASEVPVWSHLELSYFRDVVPADVIHDLVFKRQSAEVHLLRAEVLLTTPSAFVMPRGWRGSADRPERRTSIEYIHVRPTRLGEYRDIMRHYIGPAAASLVVLDKVGMFRAMETAAVLHHDASLKTDWNQIHLSEVDTDGFEGFGQAFDAALREVAPAGGFAKVFAGLGEMRTIPRWTFNDAVMEANLAAGSSGSTMAPPG